MIFGWLTLIGITMLLVAAIGREQRQRAQVIRAAAIEAQGREADRIACELAQAELADRELREAPTSIYPPRDRSGYDVSALPAPPFNDYEFARMFRRDL